MNFYFANTLLLTNSPTEQCSFLYRHIIPFAHLHCVNQVTTVRLSSSFAIKTTLNSYSKSPCPFARALLLTNTHIEQCSLLYRQFVPCAHLYCVNQVTTVRLSSSFTIKATPNSYSKSSCPFARALLLTNTHTEQRSLLYRQIVPFAHLDCVNQVTTVRLSSSFTIKTTLNSYSKLPCPFTKALLLINSPTEQCSLLYSQIIPFAHSHCVNQVTTVRLSSSFAIKTTLNSCSKSPYPFTKALLLTNFPTEQCSLLYRQIIPFAHSHCVNQVTTVRLSSSFTIKTTLNSYSKSPCPFARALLLTNTHIEQCSLLYRQIVPFAHLDCVNQVTTVRLCSSFTIKTTLNSYSKSTCPFTKALLLTNTHIEQCSLLYKQIVPFAHLHCVNLV